MASATADLSGHWTGYYNYPIAVPPVEFGAVITDTDGALTGVITEQSDLPGRAGSRVQSILDGRRNGRSVQFAKMYDDDDEDYDVVFYSGEAAPGWDEIHGQWQIAGTWSGTFLMIRASASTTAVEREEAEPIGIK